MINISQNVTKVKQELKRTFTGFVLMIPVALVFFAIDSLINYGLLHKETVMFILMVSTSAFLCWSIGGLFETIKLQREEKTNRAFEALAKGKK